MKKLNLASRIAFHVLVVVFGLTLLISSASKSFSNEFNGILGGPTQELIEVPVENEDTIYYKTWYQSVEDVLEGNKAVGAAAMAEGAVLLKNANNALPLNKGDNVSLFGVGAYNAYYTQSGGAVCIRPPADDMQTYQSVLEGAGLNVNKDLADWYNTQSGQFHSATSTTNNALPTYRGLAWSAVEASGKVPASNGGTAIFVITRSGCEQVDFRGFAGGSAATDDLALFANERSMLAGLKEAKDAGKFRKIVMIINASSTMQVDFDKEFADYGVDAAFWIGTPGNAGLGAVAGLFTGDSTPSGALADMWYSAKEYVPSYINFRSDYTSGVNSNAYTLLQEGMYLGYRYAETRYEDIVLGRDNAGTYDYAEQVSYPFGYGLSYAKFNFTNMQVTAPSAQDGEYTVKVTVTNTSQTYSGRKIVQVYLQKPYTAYDIANQIEKPSVELVGFGKTKKLAPNASETVEIKVDANRYFADFDAYGKGTYILEAGAYYLTAATDSHDAVNNILAAKTLTALQKDRMDAAGNSALARRIDITAATANNYKYKTNTGKEVAKDEEGKNLFDFADPNRCDPDAAPVTFMSRNNWTGTVFTTRTTVANSALRRAGTANDNNGSFGGHNGTANKDPDAAYPVYGRNSDGTFREDETDNSKIIPLIDMRIDESGKTRAYDDPLWETFLDQLTWSETVLLLSNGRRGTQAIRSVAKPATTEPNGPAGFMWRYDYQNSEKWQAKGFAGRIADPDAQKSPIAYPAPTIVAGTFNTELMYAVGQAFGEDGLWAGFAGIYSFTLGLHRNPYHGRSGENFSEDPYLTGMTAAMYAKGMNTKGVYTYMKHLVLNDIEQNRTTYESWITEQALRQLYLRPFEIAIQIGGAKNIMSSFARVGSYWAGSSYNLCTAYMRGECGQEGFTITDWYRTAPMGMLNGVMAGNDLPDGPVGGDATYNANGTINIPVGTSASTANEFYGRGPEGSSPTGPGGTGSPGGYGHLAQAMREAAHRIMYVTVHSNAMNYINSGTQILVHPAPWVAPLNAVVITVSVLFGVSTAFTVVMTVIYVLDRQKKKAKSEPV